MKIALALEKFSKHSGGAESYAVDLAQALVANGWEVHLFGYEWDGNPPSALFHQLKRPPFYMTASMKLLHFAFQHRSMVKNGTYDVIVGFGSTIFMNVYQSHGGAHKLSSRRKLYAIRNPALRFFKKNSYAPQSQVPCAFMDRVRSVQIKNSPQNCSHF